MAAAAPTPVSMETSFEHPALDTDSNDNSKLHRLCLKSVEDEKPLISSVDELLKVNEDAFDQQLYSRNAEGQTPVQAAASADLWQLTLKLLKYDSEKCNEAVVGDGGAAILHRAVEQDKHEVVEQLLNQGVDQFRKNAKGEVAAFSANLSVQSDADDSTSCRTLTLLLQSDTNRRLATERRNSDDATLLHLAVAAGNKDACARLIEHEASLLAVDKDGRSVLNIAIDCDCDLVEPLLKFLPDESQRRSLLTLADNEDRTPLHCAASSSKSVKLLLKTATKDAQKDKRMLRRMLAFCQHPWEREDPCLAKMLKFETVESVRHLLLSSELNDLKDSESELKKHKNNLAFLHNIGCLIFAKDARGRTPAMSAAEAANSNSLKQLLEVDELNWTTQLLADKRRTLLHGAASGGSIECLKILEGRDNLKAAANVADSDGRTPAMAAAVDGHFEAMRYLLQHCSCDVKVRDKMRRSLLHYAADRGADTEFLELLINKGVHVDGLDIEGQTPASLAARGGHDKSLSVLLNVRSTHLLKRRFPPYNQTLLHLAASADSVAAFDLLCERGLSEAVVDINGRRPIEVAVESRAWKLVVHLLTEQNEWRRDSEWAIVRYPVSTSSLWLHAAAGTDSAEVVQKLLNLELSPSVVNSEGLSPLAVSLRNCCFRAAAVLMNDLEKRKSNEKEKLLLATAHNGNSMLQMAVRAAAKVEKEDKKKKEKENDADRSEDQGEERRSERLESSLETLQRFLGLLSGLSQLLLVSIDGDESTLKMTTDELSNCTVSRIKSVSFFKQRRVLEEPIETQVGWLYKKMDETERAEFDDARSDDDTWTRLLQFQHDCLSRTQRRRLLRQRNAMGQDARETAAGAHRTLEILRRWEKGESLTSATDATESDTEQPDRQTAQPDYSTCTQKEKEEKAVEAIKAGNYETLLKLLKDGLQPTGSLKSQAASRHFWQGLRALWARDTQSRGGWPLSDFKAAVSRRDTRTVRLLTDSEACEAPAFEVMDAIGKLASSGCWHLVKQLLLKFLPNSKELKDLVDRWRHPEVNDSLFHLAMRGGSDCVVELLKTHKLDHFRLNDLRETPLLRAAKAGQWQLIHKFVKGASSTDNQRMLVALRSGDLNGRTVLHFVARSGDVKLFEILSSKLLHDAWLTLEDSNRSTPVLGMWQHRQFKLINKLTDYYLDKVVPSTSKKKKKSEEQEMQVSANAELCLILGPMFASYSEKYKSSVDQCKEIFNKIVKKRPDVMLQENYNKLNAFLNCVQSQHFLVVINEWSKLLVKVETDTGTSLLKNSDGLNILHLCSAFQDLEDIKKQAPKLNLEGNWSEFIKAKVMAGDLRDYSCLHFACQYGKTENIDFLLGEGLKLSDVVNRNDDCVDIACNNNTVNKIFDCHFVSDDTALLEVMALIDKVELAFELPSESDAEVYLRTISDLELQNQLFVKSESGQIQRTVYLRLLLKAFTEDDEYLLRCIMAYKVWSPRNVRVRDIPFGEYLGSLHTDEYNKLRASNPRLPNPIEFYEIDHRGKRQLNTRAFRKRLRVMNIFELALTCGKHNLLKSLILASQFDLIPTCLQVLIEFQEKDIDMEDIHIQEIREFCQNILVNCLNRLYMNAGKEKNRLFQYISGTIHGGPQFDATLSKTESTADDYSIFDLMQLSGCQEIFATRCMIDLVDSLWSKESFSDEHDGTKDIDPSQATIGVFSLWKHKTPKLNFFSHLFFYMVFLGIFASHIITFTSQLIWVDYVMLIYAGNFLLWEISDFADNAMPVNVRLAKEFPKRFSLQIRYWLIPDYFKDIWNLFDMTALIFLIAGLVLKVEMSFADNVPFADFYNRKVVLSTAFLLFGLRSVSMLRYFESTGPTISMIKSQIYIDLLPFMSVFIITVVSFSFFFYSLLYPYQSDFTSTVRNYGSVDYFLQIFTLPLRLTFGELGADDMNNCLGDQSSETMGTTCPYQTGVRVYFFGFMFFFLFVVNIVLINILIAKFSMTVANKDSRSRIIWRKSKVVLYFDYARDSFLPPPFFVFDFLVLRPIFAYMEYRQHTRSGNSVSPANLQIHRNWWLDSKGVNFYPKEFKEFLKYQSVRFRRNRTGFIRERSPLDQENEGVEAVVDRLDRQEKQMVEQTEMSMRRIQQLTSGVRDLENNMDDRGKRQEEGQAALKKLINQLGTQLQNLKRQMDDVKASTAQAAALAQKASEQEKLKQKRQEPQQPEQEQPKQEQPEQEQ